MEKTSKSKATWISQNGSSIELSASIHTSYAFMPHLGFLILNSQHSSYWYHHLSTISYIPPPTPPAHARPLRHSSLFSPSTPLYLPL